MVQLAPRQPLSMGSHERLLSEQQRASRGEGSLAAENLLGIGLAAEGPMRSVHGPSAALADRSRPPDSTVA